METKLTITQFKKGIVDSQYVPELTDALLRILKDAKATAVYRKHLELLQKFHSIIQNCMIEKRGLTAEGLSRIVEECNIAWCLEINPLYDALDDDYERFIYHTGVENEP